MRYRIRFCLWQIEAGSAAEARKKALDLMVSKPDALITVEPASSVSGKSIWRLLLLGR